MVLNYIWVAFFVIAFIVALCKLIFMGDVEIFTELVNSTFSSSKTAFEISLGLTGILALWLGVMKIGENSGMINALSRWLSPVFCRLFPEIPKGHPAMGSIFMNLSANMLGLDNAATPMGLKAMKELQELNPKKDTATNPMVMFLVLNTSGLILIPVSIMMYRSQMGAAQPTDIFIPTLITTAISTIIGVIAVSIAQRINLLNKPILILIGCISLFFAALIYLFTQISRDEMGVYSTLIANTAVLHHPAVHPLGAMEENQCIRCLYRRSQRRLYHCHTHYPLSGCFSRWNRRFPHFRRHGYTGERYRLCSRTIQCRYQLCRCPTHCPDEVTERQRCQRTDD